MSQRTGRPRLRCDASALFGTEMNRGARAGDGRG
jgi:hypothetical protein